MLTIEQFEEEAKATAQSLQARIRGLIGRQIVVTGNYNGQVHGNSKPSLKGKTLTIRNAFVSDSGHLMVLPEKYLVYMFSGEFELVGDPVIAPREASKLPNPTTPGDAFKKWEPLGNPVSGVNGQLAAKAGFDAGWCAGWTEALQAVVVELPDRKEGKYCSLRGFDEVRFHADVVTAIEAAGLKVKP